MPLDHEIELEQASRRAKRQALGLVGGALLLILGGGLGGLFYLAPSDKTGTAAKKVQSYYVRNGVEHAHVHECSVATDDERSLELYSCKISSRSVEVFDTTPPPPTRTADTAYFCFWVDVDGRDPGERPLPPVQFFGVARRNDHGLCLSAEGNLRIYQP